MSGHCSECLELWFKPLLFFVDCLNRLHLLVSGRRYVVRSRFADCGLGGNKRGPWRILAREELLSCLELSAKVVMH